MPGNSEPIQSLLTPSTQALAVTKVRFKSKHKTLGNNGVLIAITGATTTLTMAIADDGPGGSNAYTLLGSKPDPGNGATLFVFLAHSVKAGTSVFDVTPSAACAFMQVYFAEIPEIALAAAGDGFLGALGNSVSWQSGNVTPSVTGDIVFQFGWDVANGGASFRTALTNDSANGYVWDVADNISGFAVQYKTNVAAVAQNPTITVAPAVAFISVTVALKTTAAAGTQADTKMRFRRLQMYSIFGNPANPLDVYFPTKGNLIAGFYLGFGHSVSNQRRLTAVKDAMGNGWRIDMLNAVNVARAVCQAIYSPMAKPSLTNKVTITFDSLDMGSFFSLYDIVNAPLGDPLDDWAIQDGLQTVAGDLTSIGMNPRSRNGVVMALVDQNIGTLRDLVGADYYFDQAWAPEESGGETRLADDAGIGHYFNGDLQRVTYVWIVNGGPVSDWNSVAIALRGEMNLPRRRMAVQHRRR